eukprot:s5787_g3.t4
MPQFLSKTSLHIVDLVRNIEKLSHTVSWEVEGKVGREGRPESSLAGWVESGQGCQPKPNERCLLSSLLGRDQPWAANERRSHTGGGSSSRMRADAPAYTPPSQQPRQRAWFGNAARDFHWTTPHPVAAQLAAEATQAATTRQGPIGSARSWQPELHQPAAR